MKADILTIGDELLIGQVIDTNSKWIAEQLNAIGFTIRQITSIGDDKEQIVNTLDSIINKTDLVIITGGLGPTDDDLTKPTLAKYFNTELVIDNEVLLDIENFVKAKGGASLNERNKKQAEVPKNCVVIRNKYGTAPGMLFKKENRILISLPGVPFEMKEMMINGVIPLLLSEFKLPAVIHKNILTIGFAESSLAETINEWERDLPKNIKLAYLPSPERIRLRLSMITENKETGELVINEQIEKLKPIIGNSIYGYGDMFLEEVIGKLLSERNLTLSTAESCTGGYLAGLITSIPGSSKYFKGGTIAYSNEIKQNELSVPKELIDKFGAVSEEVVVDMANNQRILFETDFAIAVSGIAGPDGGTEEKPVGTVWIAVASKDEIRTKKYNFGHLRDINIRLSCSRAFDMLRRSILNIAQ
jgi:nicotinamide-nucleotide amidase